jgi:hypothetical protein
MRAITDIGCKTCMWEEVKLDVDDEKQYDSYYRILAVVFVRGVMKQI